MTLTSRLMVVGALSGSASKKKSQRIKLYLLNRDASADFPILFPENSNLETTTRILAYAQRHSEMKIGSPGLPHRSDHEFPDIRYQEGDTITEQEAFAWGYVEPHLETIAGNFLQNYSPELSSHQFSKKLESKGLLTPNQMVSLYRGLRTGSERMEITLKNPTKENLDPTYRIFLQPPHNNINSGLVEAKVKNDTYEFFLRVKSSD